MEVGGGERHFVIEELATSSGPVMMVHHSQCSGRAELRVIVDPLGTLSRSCQHRRLNFASELPHEAYIDTLPDRCHRGHLRQLGRLDLRCCLRQAQEEVLDCFSVLQNLEYQYWLLKTAARGSSIALTTIRGAATVKNTPRSRNNKCLRARNC